MSVNLKGLIIMIDSQDSLKNKRGKRKEERGFGNIFTF